MSLTGLLIVFIIALAFVMLTIVKLKMHPFLSLLLGSILTGLMAKMDLTAIANTISNGFGSTLGGIGIIIVWGVVLGNLLYESGGVDEIASFMLRLTGEKRAPLAVALTGYVVSIPVFFDAAFIFWSTLSSS